MIATLEDSINPPEVLSGEALVISMMEYCNNQIRENSRIERAFARELTNDKIEIVTQGFGDGIGVIAKAI